MDGETEILESRCGVAGREHPTAVGSGKPVNLKDAARARHERRVFREPEEQFATMLRQRSLEAWVVAKRAASCVHEQSKSLAGNVREHALDLRETRPDILDPFERYARSLGGKEAAAPIDAQNVVLQSSEDAQQLACLPPAGFSGRRIARSLVTIARDLRHDPSIPRMGRRLPSTTSAGSGGWPGPTRQ